MKKCTALLLALVLVCSLSACGKPERPAEISTEHSIDQLPASISMVTDGQWPESDLTFGVPQAPGRIDWVLQDSDRNTSALQISNLGKKEFKNYLKNLAEAGFFEFEKVTEPQEGQGAVSIGSLYSNGQKTLSLAYGENILMLTILPRGLTAGPVKPVNSYVYAYATLDEDFVIQSVTQLYLHKKSGEWNPLYTGISGVATVILGDQAPSTHYFGAEEDGVEQIASQISTGLTGLGGEKGRVIVSGTAYGDNALAGGGSFTVFYEIQLPKAD